MQTVIGRIDRAIDMTSKIVDAVEPDRLSAATPCAGWDVRKVLNHTVGGMRLFAAELAGTDPVGAHDDDWLGADPQAAFAAAAEIDRAAWHRLDVPEATVRLRFGEVSAPQAALVHLTEVVVHGIDIALALDRPDLADDALSAELLEVMHETGGVEPFRQPGLFGAALPVDADAPAHRKLMAYVGRTWN
ncbi:TIGR03086 family metal-binding protein [Nocardia arizonensis]|uniref:TIGR03086 family metal-binding protein n=1 Tax=Nocardia arizonensis TaxID=1141647 RepID=UPI0006CFACCF|nr:TIGR03086 family metal-binding protein [Nocardia arizonensis]